jgi:predicted nucleotidyltransferase
MRGRSEEDRQMTSGRRFLASCVTVSSPKFAGQLAADPVVDGVAVIGSLGRGEADNWSDIDLPVLMGDGALAR